MLNSDRRVLNALRELVKSQEVVTFNDIARLAIVSHTTVQQSLKRLKAMGLIDYYRSGVGRPYKYELLNEPNTMALPGPHHQV